MPQLEECPACRGQGIVISSETNDQYDRTHLQWEDCGRCRGEGLVEIEPDDDEE